MHVLKSVVSSLLLVTSICWIGIQHLFLTPESFTTFLISRHQNKLTSSRTNHRKAAETFDFLQLRRDWCRVKSKQIAWREILGECIKRDHFKQDKRYFCFSVDFLHQIMFIRKDLFMRITLGFVT